MGVISHRPISALLSQVLVAYTIEFDNEFERQMNEAGYPGARLSLVMWATLIRFIAAGATTVHELSLQAISAENRTKHQLGCLERWGFVTLQATTPNEQDDKTRRDGWGSARGIRGDWQIRLTRKGHAAIARWPPLFKLMEQRWEERFGRAKITKLRDQLREILDLLKTELPSQLNPSLPVLLSLLLETFRIEFDRESTTPLALCANTLRVLSVQPTPLSEIPGLTGASPETSDIGWELAPYVVVEDDPHKSRGKVVRLSPKGVQAQQHYKRLAAKIESDWEAEAGHDILAELRNSLQNLLTLGGESGPLIAEGLHPPKGTVRAGDQAPALGRRDVGVAAQKRMRDLVAQTRAFMEDPSKTLPHYPLWDMNRGFGP